jgi:hypothetical protein
VLFLAHNRTGSVNTTGVEYKYQSPDVQFLSAFTTERNATYFSTTQQSKKSTMPGRGRGVKRRSTTVPKDQGRQRVCLEEDESDRSTGRVDFEEIIRASQIIPPASQDKGCGVVNPHDGSSSQCQAGGKMNSPDGSASSEFRFELLMRCNNDDISAHVPMSVKEQICRGEFINLSLLLRGGIESPTDFGASTLHLSADGRIETRPKEKEVISSIDKWTDAFIIYLSIYLRIHVSETAELLQYMFNIREAASKQGGSAWKSYDEQFRLRQANNKTSWGHINQDLWWRCNLGRQNANNSISAPLQCLDYNKGVCFRRTCKYAHSCRTCGSNRHGAIYCNANKSNSTNTSQATDSSSRVNLQNPFRGQQQPFVRQPKAGYYKKPTRN